VEQVDNSITESRNRTTTSKLLSRLIKATERSRWSTLTSPPVSNSNGNVIPSIKAITRGALPSGIRAGNIKIQGFSVREEPTELDGTNKENIAVGDSAKN